MAKQAKTLDPQQLATLLAYIDANSTLPERDRLIVLLSFEAGLRVGEIAQIDYSALTDAQGRIARTIHVSSEISKGSRDREVPMSLGIKKALEIFMTVYPDAPGVAISSQPWRWSRRNGKPTSKTPALSLMRPKALALYYGRLLRRAGFIDSTSHSGRRTFATEMSRKLAKHHCSLRDLQKLLGHARLDTTERYLEPSDDTRALVGAW